FSLHLGGGWAGRRRIGQDGKHRQEEGQAGSRTVPHRSHHFAPISLISEPLMSVSVAERQPVLHDLFCDPAEQLAQEPARSDTISPDDNSPTHAVYLPMSTPIPHLDRRAFLQSSVLAGGLALAAPRFLRAKDTHNRLNIAIIGSGGRGAANLAGVSSENIVALCGVSEAALNQAAKNHPKRGKGGDLRNEF